MKKLKISTLMKVLLLLIICLPIIRWGINRYIMNNIMFVDMRRHSNYSEEQKTLLAIENGLLYCDLKDGGSICRYDVQTKESHKLSQLSGELRRTENGIIYITEQEIFQFLNNELSYLCDVSDDSYKISDRREDFLYWVEENTDGIYCEKIISSTTEYLSGLRDADFAPENEHIVFIGYDEDFIESYYEILPDGTVEKLVEDSGSTETIFGDKLYYIQGEQIHVFNLESKAQEGTIEIMSKDWEKMEVTDTGIFIREHPKGHIWYLEFSTGVWEKIIEQ